MFSDPNLNEKKKIRVLFRSGYRGKKRDIKQFFFLRKCKLFNIVILCFVLFCFIVADQETKVFSSKITYKSMLQYVASITVETRLSELIGEWGTLDKRHFG